MPKLTRKQKRLHRQISDGVIQLKEYKPKDKKEKSKYIIIDEQGKQSLARNSDVAALIERGLIKENKKKEVVQP